ncbi:Clr5 domain-containing protein [Podospora aff. communis PSN243]|uniref:Clr5 domain-containing protein n=1 Tax=Podospora aff. communis PSN243 TaxID=3040156 RepID=A0AAV9G5K8_9PEZI|nr:Clr5 domain-containing protein [Podospora aff. communis PSN243]
MSITTLMATPSKPADWEVLKPVIKNLYLGDNLRLQDVISVMRETHQFRATARMYKTQFLKWGWHKYDTANRIKWQESTSRSPRKGKKGVRRGYGTTVEVPLPKRLNIFQTAALDASKSQPLLRVMASFRNFILGSSEQKHGWLLQSPFTKPSGYNSVMISHLMGALLQFQEGRVSQGGRLLRAAFLELEAVIANGHIASVWDCCVAIPQVAANYDRVDVLLIFLRHLTAFCSRYSPDHPMSPAAESLVAFFQSTPSNASISDYTTLAWRLWTDTLTSLVGEGSILTLHAHRAYLIIHPSPPTTIAASVLQKYTSLAQKASSTLGNSHTSTLAIEFEALLTQSRFQLHEPDSNSPHLYTRLRSILSRLSSKPENYTRAPECWKQEDRQIFRGCWFLGAMHAVKAGDVITSREFLTEFLAAPSDGEWVQYAMRLEHVLNSVGEVVESDKVRQKRESVQFSRDVTEVLTQVEEEARVT